MSKKDDRNHRAFFLFSLFHNIETFGKLIDAVSEKTGTKWEVDAELDTCCSEYVPKYRWVGPGRRVRLILRRGWGKGGVVGLVKR